MISKFHLLAAVAGGLLYCTLAGAQVHERVSAVRAPAARNSQTVAHTPGNGVAASQPAGQARLTRVSPSRRASSSPVSTSSQFLSDAAGVPGPGFDFPHLAAIGAARGSNFSSHGDHRDHRGQGFLLPILFGSAYPYYADDADEDPTQAQTDAPQQLQPQVAGIQQPEPSQQDADSSGEASDHSGATPAAPSEEPVPDNADFILVRRDGRILFASLFSVVGAQLQYVTPEGIRHSMAVSDIDSDATQQMNEARGSSVQIHN